MWNSIELMTLADVLIIALSTVAAIHFVRGARARQSDLGPGMMAILIGLVFTALFYLLDLGAMHLAPLFMPMPEAMNFMERLHLDARWAVSLASVGLIVAGLIVTQRDMRYRLEMEELVRASSTELIAIDGETTDLNFEITLRRVAEVVGADGGYIFAFSENRESFRLTHSWRAGFAPRSIEKGRRFESAERPWTVSRLLRGEVFVMGTLRDLPSEARGEGLSFQSLGFQSLILVPMSIEGGTTGFVGFSFSNQPHRFRQYEISLLATVGQGLSNALVRRRAENQLQHALAEVRELTDRLRHENVYLHQEIRQAHGFGELVGESDRLQQCLRAAADVASTDVPVLLTGETGTGKELLARAIHDLSARNRKTMISVNCAALPASLIENELFGHEKGAYTGAETAWRGRFEMADHGTLFLDEIGDLPIELQGKLLRVLQEGAFERVGSTVPVRVDVRIIVATNRDLREAVDRAAFRSDLYFRINTFPIHLPPLRERGSDVELLAKHFVRKHAPRLAPDVESISARMLNDLSRHTWPGNVRELESTIERALISSSGGSVLDWVPDQDGSIAGEARVAWGPLRSLRDIERDYILEVLERTDWVIEGEEGAAALLALAPSTLRSKMRKLGIARQRSHAISRSVAAG